MAGASTTKTDKVASKLDSEQVLHASQVLLKSIKDSSKESTSKSGKLNVFDADEDEEAGGLGAITAETPIWLTLTTKRHVQDSHRLKPSKIAVPHPLNQDAEKTICLITADPQRAFKDLIADDSFPAELRERITRVIDITHLFKKFKAYEAQRKLFSEHDIFLGDDRIVSRLPKALGKTFYRSTVKRPIPVILQKTRPKEEKKDKKKSSKEVEKDVAVAEAVAKARSPAQLAAQIEKAIGSVYVSLSPTTNTAVRVAAAGWPAAHVAENVEATVQALVDKFVPQQWKNVKSIFLKGPRTIALPIWQTDELWLDGNKEVLKTGSEELKAFEAKQAAKKEKANVGKKRKASAVTEEGEGAKDETDAKKTKKAKSDDSKKAKASTKKAAAESDDAELDRKIAEQKAKLKKQKNAAKKAMDL